MLMKILITGALGFIGSHISEHYLLKGDEVFGVDNQSGKYPADLYHYNRSLLVKHKLFSCYSMDIKHRTGLDALIKTVSPNVVVHTAALTGVRDGANHPYQYVSNNTLGTQNLLEACRKKDNIKIILLSSSSVYGDQSQGPFSEQTRLLPKSIYAISKQAMESIAEYYSKYYGLNILIVRPFSVYGPRGRMNMLPLILLKSIAYNQPFYRFGNDKNNKRDWTYVNDFVEALDRLIQKKSNNFDIINIGSGNPMGIEQFLVIFKTLSYQILHKRVTEVKIDKPAYEMETTWADTSKLFRYIGKTEFTPLNKGVENLLKYYHTRWNTYFPI